MSVTSEQGTAGFDLEARQELNVQRRREEKLSLLQEFNELLVESSGDCIIVMDDRESVLSINKTGRELLGIHHESELLNRHWVSLFPGLEVRPEFALPRQARQRAKYHATTKGASGDTRFWDLTFTGFGSLSGPIDRFLLIARDVTEHMLVEKALRHSEEAFRKLFEENPIGIVLAGLDYRITKVNNALSAMLGFSERELAGRDIWTLPAPTQEDLIGDSLDRLLRGEIRSFQSEAVFATKRKQLVWGHLTTSVLRDAENLPIAVFQMVENIQDRKTTEEQVMAYQEQLQSLASELSLGEERERRRIATNLHDRIGQSLAFAHLKLAAMSNGASSKSISEVRELIEQAIVDTRSLTFELSPPVLYELGLVAAIEWLARKIQQEHGIQTRFHDDGQPKPLDDNFRVVLFQSVRELLVNVVKHARASHAQVLLRRDSDALRIIIEDDGVGFELSHASAKRESARSFGLFNLRERVEYLGGQAKIRSEIGRGTRVTLIAPLKIEKTGPAL